MRTFDVLLEPVFVTLVIGKCHHNVVWISGERNSSVFEGQGGWIFESLLNIWRKLSSKRGIACAGLLRSQCQASIHVRAIRAQRLRQVVETVDDTPRPMLVLCSPRRHQAVQNRVELMLLLVQLSIPPFLELLWHQFVGTFEGIRGGVQAFGAYAVCEMVHIVYLDSALVCVSATDKPDHVFLRQSGEGFLFLRRYLSVHRNFFR